MPLNFNEKLDNYAKLAVNVGLNLNRGQRLAIRAPITAAPLVRKIAARAYDAGSPYVQVHWRDEQLDRLRYQHAPPDSFSEVPFGRRQADLETIDSGGAILSIVGDDPDLLQDQDPTAVATARAAVQKDMKPVTESIMSHRANWSVIAAASGPWAAKVFPEDDRHTALDRLWEAIFSSVRADAGDPLEAWDEQVRLLSTRRDYLNDKSYRALHLTAPGTDLSVGLPERHTWMAAESSTSRGITFVANLPTEEVFTLPHKDRVDGTVRSSKPLSYSGQLIDGFELTFEGGRVTRAAAETGQVALERLLETDEGASRLGEIALVAESSPIARSGLLYYNTLFDENAASHIALGRAYRFCLEGGGEMSDAEACRAGANDSLAHVDFMIGSRQMDVDGITASGEREAVMRAGEWVV